MKWVLDSVKARFDAVPPSEGWLPEPPVDGDEEGVQLRGADPADGCGGTLALLVLVFFTVAWWGGIGPMVYGLALGRGDAGFGRAFMMVFMLPFFLAGVGLLLMLVGFALQRYTVRVELLADRAVVAPGDVLRLSWHTGGFRSLYVTLVGEETLTYQTGNNHETTTHRCFYRRVLHRDGGPEAGRDGDASVQIPTDAMHSFQSSHAGVRWFVRVEGVARMQLPLQVDHAILVRPEPPR